MTLIPDLIAQLTLHGLVAALVVEGTLRWASITSPDRRFLYRASALAIPVILAPVFALATFRRDAFFQDLSLFVSARWSAIPAGPMDARSATMLLLAVVGVLLLGRDLIPAAGHLLRRRQGDAALPIPETVREDVAVVAGRMGVEAPAIHVRPDERHGLHCGATPAHIFVTTGTIATLSRDELRVALAHELAHLAHRDVTWGWVVFGLRVLQAANPVAQITGRRAVEELEFHADDRAREATGSSHPLARALVKCARQRGDDFLGLAGRGRLHNLERRCHRLLSPARSGNGDTGGLAAVWLTLAVLLLFVQ
ncbi:MAG: M56 family metallopeptidase [Vicinamibacterales bacterium]